MQNNTPFHPRDQIRNTKFLALYNWAKGLGKVPTQAYYIARGATLKAYPITPGELLYPITNTHHASQ